MKVELVPNINPVGVRDEDIMWRSATPTTKEFDDIAD